ncbi:MAG: SDR family oxidoreductase [Myxococcales bacterium]|nr:SDR family oxidoreductase [Myxococcales bacterium]MDP3231556.1 SDR family oxidoreductase [Myxococcales bacterium]
MKVLIAGVSSALARQVAMLMKSRGHEVLGMDRRPWRDAPEGIEVFETDLRKRAAEDIFRTRRPECVIHMATVNALTAGGDERARINVGGTRALFEHSVAHGVKHVVFVGRHTYYGASADSPLYHTEDEPPHGIGSFPELADLVAADLFAANALWREPKLCTSVLRLVYTLGPSQQGTLASFLKGKRVPLVMGYDPLFQFIFESDAARAITLAAEQRAKGIFNVCGPNPVPLSMIVQQTGRTTMMVPEPLLRALLGRFGFPKLPPGALEHIKFPIVVDGRAFKKATGFTHEVDEVEALQRYRLLTAR